VTEGDVVLTPLPQADGHTKPRPAVLLRQMPPFNDWLVCGVSTQLHHEVVGFDDVIKQMHLDFAGSGLKAPSLIRLGFLAVLPSEGLLGVLGSVSPERHERLLQRLGAFLQPHGAANKTSQPLLPEP
jgi:mRNA interferase MazF